MTVAMLSRRGVLGALAAVPVLTLPFAPAAASTAAWDRAYRDYLETEAALTAASGAQGEAEERYYAERDRGPASSGLFLPGDTTASYNERMSSERAAYVAADVALHKKHRVPELEEANDIACAASSAAIRALLNVPAPHFEAVITKIGVVSEVSAGFDLIIADIRRLGGAA